MWSLWYAWSEPAWGREAGRLGEAARTGQAHRQALVFSAATGAERLAGMRAKLRSPEVLRDLYVLKEILGPPVSLRQ